jgi:hypothetical protein
MMWDELPTNADIGRRAGELLDAWLAHHEAHMSCHRNMLASGVAATTIWVTYGVQSLQGRIIDRGTFLMSRAQMHLDSDFRWLGEEKGLWQYKEAPPTTSIEPSPAALRIFAHHLESIGRRKLPSTPEIDAALVAYADERISLLRNIETLFEDGHRLTHFDDCVRWAREVAKERRMVERLERKTQACGDSSMNKAAILSPTKPLGMVGCCFIIIWGNDGFLE